MKTQPSPRGSPRTEPYATHPTTASEYGSHARAIPGVRGLMTASLTAGDRDGLGRTRFLPVEVNRELVAVRLNCEPVGAALDAGEAGASDVPSQ